MTVENLIEDIVVTGNRLEVRTNATFRRKFLWDDFFVEYNEDIGLDRMDASIYLAPFILNVAQLVWFSNENYRLDSLDVELARSLQLLRDHARALYPRRRWEGELVADRLVGHVRDESIPPADADSVAILFTGGVDSVYSSFCHHPKRQLLITFWGNETPLDMPEKWEQIREQAAAFGERFGHHNLFIKSNAKEIIKRKSLRPDIPVWWPHLQREMGLVGLTIPALVHSDCPTVVISASKTHEFEHADNLEREIGRLRCGGVSVRLEGYQLSRQDKLQHILATCRERGLPVPQFSVCARPSSKSLNCCRCEKCLRTACGILLAGGTPSAFGLPATPEEVVERIEDGFARYRLKMGPGELFFWRDMQEGALKTLAALGRPKLAQTVATFSERFIARDLLAYATHYNRRNRWQHAAKNLLSRHPWLFERLRKAVERRGAFGY